MAITSEQKVGLFFLSALIVLGMMIEFVEDWRPFEDQYPYYGFFNSSVGLKVSDPVRIAGVEMGKVRNISIEQNQVRVDFYVNQSDLIREDSVARVRQTNLLGGVFLGLDFGTSLSHPLAPGSEVKTEEGSNIDELITNIDQNQDRVLRPLGEMVDETRDPLVDAISRLERIMTKIDEGDGTLGKLVNNPVLYDEMSSVSSRLDKLLAKLEAGEGSFGRMMQDPTLFDNLNRTMQNLAELTEQIKSGQGTFGQLVNDQRLYNEATRTLESLRVITEKVGQGEGTLGKLYNDAALYDNLTDTIAHINSIAAKIDDGQGTLGRLINDDDLYRDAKTTLNKVEKSVDGLRDTGPLSALGIVVGTLF
jgi:phospholipid/cholesterol/gamma-HCH transport system substrate-binding protein